MRAASRTVDSRVSQVARTGFVRPAFGWFRSPYVLLFILLLFVFAYTPPRWQDWNQNSRFNLTQAIVEQQTVRIDDYVANTGDYAEIDGRIYTDKAPGMSLMAVPVYWVTEQLQPLGLSALSERLGASGGFASTLNPDGEGLSQERVDVAVALYISTFFVVAIPAALMLVLLALIVLRLTGCRTASILVALIIGLATPVFTYSQAFYGHIPAAACLVGAIALLVLRDDKPLSHMRLLGIGALLGWAVVIELPVAVAGLPIALWAVWQSGRRGVLYGVLGAVPPLAVLAIYDLIAFGTVTPVGYEHSALWQEQHSTGFLSLTYPHWDAIYGLLWSPFRGLLFFSPVILVAFAGMVIGFRNRTQRPATILAAGIFAVFFLIIASSIMWWGGFSVGPRYLVPVIPMLGIPLGIAIARLNSSRILHRGVGLGLTLLLTCLSGLLIWASTFAGQGYPPDSTRNPLGDYVSPRIQDGDVARNLGMALGLDGLVSLFPLALAVLVGTAGIVLTMSVGSRTAAGRRGSVAVPEVSLRAGDEVVT